jgi:hypothetical protein
MQDQDEVGGAGSGAEESAEASLSDQTNSHGNNEGANNPNSLTRPGQSIAPVARTASPTPKKPGSDKLLAPSQINARLTNAMTALDEKLATLTTARKSLDGNQPMAVTAVASAAANFSDAYGRASEQLANLRIYNERKMRAGVEDLVRTALDNTRGLTPAAVAEMRGLLQKGELDAGALFSRLASLATAG